MAGHGIPLFGPSYKTRAAFLPRMDPQGLKLPDVIAAEMKDDIWKEPAVGVTCEPTSANLTASPVCGHALGAAVILLHALGKQGLPFSSTGVWDALVNLPIVPWDKSAF